ESVLGLVIGSKIVDAAQKFSGPQEHEWLGNPWALAAKDEKLREALGHLLKPEDLGNGGGLGDLNLLSWSNNKVLIVLQKNEVRAVVIHEPYRAATGRGLKIDQSESKLKDVYPELP